MSHLLSLRTKSFLLYFQTIPPFISFLHSQGLKCSRKGSWVCCCQKARLVFLCSCRTLISSLDSLPKISLLCWLKWVDLCWMYLKFPHSRTMTLKKFLEYCQIKIQLAFQITKMVLSFILFFQHSKLKYSQITPRMLVGQ